MDLEGRIIKMRKIAIYEEQKLDMIAVYKCLSADRGHYEEKRDYSDTINKIIARQEKLFGYILSENVIFAHLIQYPS